ncbi:hypothetical protein K474DRAFT_1664727 [Panus rudis PR-1116 ss-1]|nr:hypothetical protein K474DRAFT_1664727 [Panus rudis PR-1116 ss-1]
MSRENGANGANGMDVEYDPDQNPEEQRHLRKGYRQLQEGMQSSEKDIESVVRTVNKADELFQHVRATAEATLDSNVLLQASTIGIQKARAMKSGSGAFDIDDFISQLVHFMGGRKILNLEEDDNAGGSRKKSRRRAVEDDADDDDDVYEDEDDNTQLDWEKVGRKAIAKSHRVSTMDFMLGPLSIEPKIRNAAKRARLEKNKADEKKPQEITEDDITRSENETTKNVIVLEKLLEQTGKINLFKFIINPNDFGQSVENMFYLSFLIRDGKCALETEDGQPVIYACDSPTREDYDQGLKKQQIIMEFDMATWRRAIEVFEITQSTIPQRPKAQTRLGGKWYG